MKKLPKGDMAEPTSSASSLSTSSRMSQGLCPSCGAAVNLTAGQSDTKCQYCESIVVAQQAVDQFAHFNEIKKTKYNGALLLAETAREAGNYKKALTHYSKVLEQGSTDAEVWLSMAACLISMEEDERTDYKLAKKAWKEAVAAWKAALKIASNPGATKKRVATEINVAFTELFRMHEARGWKWYYDLDYTCLYLPDSKMLFALMDSALDLSLSFWPANPASAKNGIVLCGHVARIIKKDLSEWVEQYVELGVKGDWKTSDEDFDPERDIDPMEEFDPIEKFSILVCEAESKYLSILQQTDPKFLEGYKSIKSKNELAFKKAKLAAAAKVNSIKQDQEKAGCFIATACYGNYDHPSVKELREFRDGILQPTKFGRAFVQCYYKWSPPFANLVAKSEILKNTARVLIVTPAVTIARVTKQNPRKN
jgi:tetratricopeptide (TPR) repeat protein